MDSISQAAKKQWKEVSNTIRAKILADLWQYYGWEDAKWGEKSLDNFCNVDDLDELPKEIADGLVMVFKAFRDVFHNYDELKKYMTARS